MTINTKDYLSLKYYIGFCMIVLGIYFYSMIYGIRFLSFNESNHQRDRTGIHRFYHK
jgi:uncharacterized protein (DUF2062 family)